MYIESLTSPALWGQCKSKNTAIPRLSQGLGPLLQITGALSWEMLATNCFSRKVSVNLLRKRWRLETDAWLGSVYNAVSRSVAFTSFSSIYFRLMVCLSDLVCYLIFWSYLSGHYSSALIGQYPLSAHKGVQNAISRYNTIYRLDNRYGLQRCDYITHMNMYCVRFCKEGDSF